MRTKIAKLLYALADAVGGLDSQAERETRRVALEAFSKLGESAESKVKRAEQEAQRREKMGLLNFEVPDLWQSHYYMTPGFRVFSTEDDSQGHWRGGKPLHDDAICPLCKKPLLMFWDINCADPRFRGVSPELFPGTSRLPLYYCCRRPEPTIYQLLPSGGIRTIKPDLQGYEESPFPNPPSSFERKPIRLEIIPREMENLLLIANEIACEWLNREEQDRLVDYLSLSYEPAGACDITFSQFGGLPNQSQGHRAILCPNKLCDTHKMDHPMLRNTRLYTMKELAAIDVNADFNLEGYATKVLFHICWRCLTIHATYVAD